MYCYFDHRTWFGFLGLSVSGVAITRVVNLGELVLLHAPSNRTGQSGNVDSSYPRWTSIILELYRLMLMLKTSHAIPVLHYGGFHHRRRGRVAAIAPKTEGTVYRHCMLDLLSNGAFVRYGSEYILYKTARI